jgi:hypothetical protein
VIGGTPGGMPGGFAMSAGIVAPPSMREQIQATKDQTAVWKEVAKVERDNDTTSATNTLNAVFEDKKVGEKLEGYEQAFVKGFLQPGVTGVVVAVAGEIVAADVFASPRLFRAYWPKLLKSYSLQAMNAAAGVESAPEADAAQAFLSRSVGTRATDGRRAYRLVEHQSDADASFELESVSVDGKQLVHFNRVKKN